MRPFIIAGAVIILGGLGYFGYTKLPDDAPSMGVNLPAVATSSTETASKKMAFSQLVKQGGSYQCTVKQYMSDVENDGVVFMDKNRLRGEFSTIAEGMKIDSTMITKDGYTYTWSSFAPKSGFKVKVLPVDETKNESTSTSGTYSWNADQIGDYYCEAWTPDESKFTLPSSVMFTEVK